MNSPATDQQSRDLIEDLQLRDDDRTEDLRQKEAPETNAGKHQVIEGKNTTT